MTANKPTVSAILPAGQAFGKWINEEGGDPGAIPFVAFAAGHKSRDAEIAAADALLVAFVKHRTATHELGRTKLGQPPCLTCEESSAAMDAYRAVRAGQSGPAGGEGQ